MKKSKLLALVLSLCVIGAMMIVGVSAADPVELSIDSTLIPSPSDANRWYFEAGATNGTYAANDIKVEFYSGDAKIATVWNTKAITVDEKAITINLQVGVDNSSTWDQDNLNLDAAKLPTSAKIYYKDTLKATSVLEDIDESDWEAVVNISPAFSVVYDVPNVYFNQDYDPDGKDSFNFDLKFPSIDAEYAKGSIMIELYNNNGSKPMAIIRNEKVLETAATSDDTIEISACLCFGSEESSSWEQYAVGGGKLNLKENTIPKRAILKINGVEYDEVTFDVDSAKWESRTSAVDYVTVEGKRVDVVANQNNFVHIINPGYYIEGLYYDATLIHRYCSGNNIRVTNESIKNLPDTLYIKWVPTPETQKQMKLVAVRGIVLTMIMPEYDIEIADAEGVTVTYTGKMTPGEDKFAFCDSWSAEWAVEEGYTLNKVLVNGEEYDAANYNVKWNDTDVTIEFDVTAPVVEEEVVEEEVVEEEVVEEEVVTEEVAA